MLIAARARGVVAAPAVLSTAFELTGLRLTSALGASDNVDSLVGFETGRCLCSSLPLLGSLLSCLLNRSYEAGSMVPLWCAVLNAVPLGLQLAATT